MILLAIDTATEACSAALLIDNELIERYEVAPRRHNELILPMVQSVLDEAGLSLAALEGIAFGAGPGSFTGIRIAAGVVQGLALGLGIKVAPISTLKAMAFEAFRQNPHELAAMAIDARMGEIYWGVYRRQADGTPSCLIEDQVIRPDEVLFPDGEPLIGVGTGWATYGDLLMTKVNHRHSVIEPQTFPKASAIARLGAVLISQKAGVCPEAVLPFYLRNNVAKKTAERFRVE
ncbi:MAG: tRNA (adenosine(37)-N6)-threonylcarbamoyltransferase complex dimerization subunit type 1 TsaB [Methylococcus sp.]|jgi:tRNA threonylcarbamoyladenosine biosynthesis protein TsaB